MCASLLVVEDDQEASVFLAENLRDDGHEVTVVETAAEAVAALRRMRADIALIDVTLPDGSGLEIVRMVRAGEAGATDIGVIVVSGRAGERDRIRAFERGVDDYIVKPFSYPELLLRTASLDTRLRGRVAAVIAAGPLQINLAARAVTIDGALLRLPGKEYELLVALAVPPLINTFRRSSTNPRMRSASSLEIAPRAIRSSNRKGDAPKRRIVISAPSTAIGGRTTLTRDPSGRRASTIGVASSMRRPQAATSRTAVCRNSSASRKRVSTRRIRPSTSTQTS